MGECNQHSVLCQTVELFVDLGTFITFLERVLSACYRFWMGKTLCCQPILWLWLILYDPRKIFVNK